MEMKMFAIRDEKLEAFMSPMFFRSNGEAIRAFFDEVERPDSKMHRHPGDYVLYFVGVWTDDNGVVLGLEEPLALVSADEIGPFGKEPKE
jgi:hypothetical protein